MLVSFSYFIKDYHHRYPLRTILIAAIVLRLIAAFFSEGYAFHDDHFDVTRVAHSWSQGIPHWLGTTVPPKHSMLYAGINAAFFWVIQSVGITDPYTKTLLIRIIHAFYSCFIVFFGFKITLILADLKRAQLVAWILALLWFMPFMSVRFLVEMVCIPPVLAGFYFLAKNDKQTLKKIGLWLLSGVFFGLAFSLRYHTILFAGGLGLVLLYRKEWKGSVLFTTGFLMAAFITVGLVDIVFFEYPFHSIVEYFDHNSSNSDGYITGSPLKFTLTTFGFIFPLVSVFLMVGYIKSSKVEPMMFVALLVFFVFHSAFPNQQERFIFPMFPILIILGVIGWENIVSNSEFWLKHTNLLKNSWRTWWVMNLFVGLFMATTFSKKDRIEPLHVLSQKGDLTALIIENEKSVKQPPVYYLGENTSDYNEWEKGILGLDSLTRFHLDHKVVYRFYPSKSVEELKKEIDHAGKIPNYVIFQGVRDLEKRKSKLFSVLGDRELIHIESVKPSTLDRFLHFFNPKHHRDQTATIFRIQ